MREAPLSLRYQATCILHDIWAEVRVDVRDGGSLISTSLCTLTSDRESGREKRLFPVQVHLPFFTDPGVQDRNCFS